jgi:dienelactone hydrolase
VSPRSQDIKQAGLVGFLAQPDAPTKGGVVILPTIYGVNPFVRGYAETLARGGRAAPAKGHEEGPWRAPASRPPHGTCMTDFR